MKLFGKVVCIGNDVNTDLIFPGEGILKMNMNKAHHDLYQCTLMKYGFLNFPIDRNALKEATFLIAGTGLGAGSSRQYAVEVIKGFGIKGVIAESIHPIFYRNLWNVGIFAQEIKDISAALTTGDELMVDLEKGAAVDQRSKKQWTFTNQLPHWLFKMISYGGLINYLESREKK